MGLSRTVSEINGHFSRKSPIFPTPRAFNAPAEAFPFELSIYAWVKKLEWWGYQMVKKSFKIVLAV